MHGPVFGRIVEKDGTYRVKHLQAPGAFRNHLRNVFVLLLDIQWRWIVLLICVVFPFAWLVFALLYYGISWHHGDFQPPSANETTERKLCIANSLGFLSMFLFSVETQTTIGYGFRFITESCPVAIFFVCLQYITGATLEACVVSLIWVRLIRPKQRSRQIVFSRYACVKSDDQGRPCFRIRLFDTHARNLVQTWIRLYLAKKRPLDASNSRMFTFELRWMDLGQLYGKEKLLLLWPVEVVHVIDSASPLYPYVHGQRCEENFEIIAVVEGVIEATGLVTQTRTSYTPQEIKWDHQFVPIIYTRDSKNLNLIFRELDNIIPTSASKPAILHDN